MPLHFSQQPPLLCQCQVPPSAFQLLIPFTQNCTHVFGDEASSGITINNTTALCTQQYLIPGTSYQVFYTAVVHWNSVSLAFSYVGISCPTCINTGTGDTRHLYTAVDYVRILVRYVT